MTAKQRAHDRWERIYPRERFVPPEPAPDGSNTWPQQRSTRPVRQTPWSVRVRVWLWAAWELVKGMAG